MPRFRCQRTRMAEKGSWRTPCVVVVVKVGRGLKLLLTPADGVADVDAVLAVVAADVVGTAVALGAAAVVAGALVRCIMRW